jgi:hypothetical protein
MIGVCGKRQISKSNPPTMNVVKIEPVKVVVGTPPDVRNIGPSSSAQGSSGNPMPSVIFDRLTRELIRADRQHCREIEDRHGRECGRRYLRDRLDRCGIGDKRVAAIVQTEISVHQGDGQGGFDRQPRP